MDTRVSQLVKLYKAYEKRQFLALAIVYPNCVRKMCWTHVSTRCEDRLKGLVNEKIRGEILDDIRKVQMCLNEQQFRKSR